MGRCWFDLFWVPHPENPCKKIEWSALGKGEVVWDGGTCIGCCAFVLRNSIFGWMKNWNVTEGWVIIDCPVIFFIITKAENAYLCFFLNAQAILHINQKGI